MREVEKTNVLRVVKEAFFNATRLRALEVYVQTKTMTFYINNWRGGLKILIKEFQFLMLQRLSSKTSAPNVLNGINH